MSLFEELKRRNVFRVGIAYLIASWLILQVIDVVGPILELPNWISRAILLLLGVGFIVAIILAWAYELTPGGVKREKDVDRSESITPRTGRKLNGVIIGALAIALAFFAYERFVLHDHGAEPDATIAEIDKSIAVLPFDNRSADDSDAYFVDGIHDDILTQLHKLSGLDKVISRTTMDQYRDTDKTIPQIAEELGVSTILEGGVQRAGNRVRITVQLINAANDEHLWAENYDRELTTENVFEIQSEIATAIAGSLRATLTTTESEGLASIPTRSLDAYDAYLLGKHTMADRSQQGLLEAQGYFERAIELDPEFALAYASLADAQNLYVVFSTTFGNVSAGSDSRKLYSQMAEANARKALELNGALGEAHASLAFILYYKLRLDGEFDDARSIIESHFARAMELTPNYASVYRWYAQFLGFAFGDRAGDSVAIAERATALDPLSPINFVILTGRYASQGQYDSALASIDRALELDPDSEPVLWRKADLYGDMEETAKEIVAYRQLLDHHPGNQIAYFQIANGYLTLGASDEFTYWKDQLLGAADGSQNVFLNFSAAGLDQRVEDARAVLEESGVPLRYCAGCFAAIASQMVRNGQAEALLLFIRKHGPELIDSGEAPIDQRNIRLVAAAIWALRQTGDEQAAGRLATDALDYIENNNQSFNRFLTEGQIHAAAGNRQFALDALEQNVENGWRGIMNGVFADPFIESLQDEERFQAVKAIVDSDLAARYEWLLEQERLGNVPPLPQ
jgi:TolB-like protein/Tfp pilus assembly protein PilF